jgi:hypothetical protein
MHSCRYVQARPVRFKRDHLQAGRQMPNWSRSTSSPWDLAVRSEGQQA